MTKTILYFKTFLLLTTSISLFYIMLRLTRQAKQMRSLSHYTLPLVVSQVRFYSAAPSPLASASSSSSSAPGATSSAPDAPTTKRTSLFNTAKSFNNPAALQLNITNKKYSPQGDLLILDLTPRAIKKLTTLAETEQNPNIALRIGVESGGCHGFQYNLDLTDLSTVTEDDCVFEKGGASVIIDDASLGVLKESKVDYTTELIGSMFKVVESPYMVTSCGCGSSFDLDFDKLGN